MKLGLALRSLLWTLLIPGVVTVYLPWRFFGLGEVRFHAGDPLHYLGAALAGAGAVLLFLCIREFFARGRGTLSPVDPPRELVVTGLYRFVRNPMYLGVATLLAGEILLTRSTGLLVMALVWFVLVNIFVVFHEEPWLRRTFGASYEAYAGKVRRWRPRLHPL